MPIKPELPLTVSLELWKALSDAVRPTYADSYLSGARETGGRLVPHTVTAYRQLKSEPAAMAVIQSRGLRLIEPLPFGHPDRPDS